jgi:hypothetical protein
MSEISRGLLISTAQTMAVDRMTCEVVTAFRQQDIPSVLLKGPSIAQWLYPLGGRSYGDSDLLVSQRAKALEGLGFGQPIRGRAAHAHTYRRADPRAGLVLCVDLHRSLPYVTVPPSEAWRVLSSQTEEIRLGDVDIAVLGIPQRILHIAMHAAQHAFESTKPLEDLRRAIEAVDLDGWREAAIYSRALGVEDALAAGLGLIPEGRDVAEHLGLTDRRRGILLIAASPESEGSAYEVQRLLDATSLGERLTLLYDGVVISPALMRSKSPLARRGRGGLLLAYLFRPFQLSRRLGHALVTRRRILK